MVYHQNSIELSDYLRLEKENGRSIGFIPTMGALHEGHLSLVKRANKENDIVVCSIFVNPDQFNDPKDFDRYPRTLDGDLELLKSQGCNIVFVPSVSEIYPEPDSRGFDLLTLGNTMEGNSRPGHFDGVIRVVNRLFNIVQPNKAYFGEKDFQQLAIIRFISKTLNPEVEVVGCPTIRESDGLAYSSRNTLLNTEERSSAALISKVLKQAADLREQLTVTELETWVKENISKDPNLRIDYFNIVNPYTLEKIDDWGSGDNVVGCIAVYCNQVRLIDNITFNSRAE